MSWLTLAFVALVIGILTAKFAPGIAKTILKWFVRFKFGILAIAGVAVSFYLLTTGVAALILLGMIGLVIATWNFLFNDPLGWVRPMLPF